MKDVVIHSEVELVEKLQSILDPKVFRLVSLEPKHGKGRGDIEFDVHYAGHTANFIAECKLRATVEHLAELQKKGKGAPHPLLVTVRLTESLATQCRERGISCLDLNGRIWISAPGLLIERHVPNLSIRYRLAEPEIRFFSPKSTRLARVLLDQRDRIWRQTDLAALTGLSQGLVSRLLNHAASQGWVAGKRGDWKLKAFDALLDAWAQQDDWRKRTTIRQYSTLEPDFRVIAQRLVEGLPGELVFTQWFAASLRYPYTTPPALSVYRRQFPSAEDLKRLDLREVANGGKLWILAPRDEGVFQAVHQVNGFPSVCDAQIYLDLIHAGLRGDDQAKALREWEGFCRT